MKDKSLRPLFLLLASFLWSAPSLADRWYHVEMVVFEQLDTVTDEQWPEMTVRSEQQKVLTPGMATDMIQPDKTSTLVNSVKRLARSPHYRVIYHRAWRQPVLKKHYARPVKIASDDNMIEGTLLLYKATYLYAAVDLWLMENRSHAAKSPALTPASEDIESIRLPHLEQARRIKIKKYYFFDHPRMGVLLQLTPVKTPDTVAESASAKPSATFSLPEEAVPTVQ